MSDDINSTRKPHNYFEEATPAQREEWAKRMQMEEEESAKISAAKAEVERIKEIGDAQRTFNVNKVERVKFTNGNGDGNGEAKGKDPIIKSITEDILSRYHFITIEESREILFYDNGVYAPGGDVVIEKTAESLYGFKLANRHLTEIKGHIMRMTFHKREELDPDINVINLKNGLYSIETGEFKAHTPDYLSITQRPIFYKPAAKPKLLGKFLQQVLYPSEIRTAVELMAYTLYKDNPYEIIVKLFGYGGNGKSVFTGIMTSLHGSHNISNVPLSAMLKNRFALSDLENKCVNIDAEMSSTTINDTTVLKKLTGRQPIRIERKNQKAYDTTLYAKLFFSANKIPEAEYESDAYFRREIIISFPNRFEDGKGADPNLLRKLTTEEELSGIFNVLVIALGSLLKNGGIFVKERSIEKRRERHELAVNPLQYFIREALDVYSNESDKTTKDSFYQAYKRFCSKHNLAVESKGNFGRILKSNRFGFQEGRDTTDDRKRYWKGVKLAPEYDIAGEQQTFEDIDMDVIS